MTATAAGTATGPTSPEGKKRSSANAYTHGLTGQTLILTPEERLAYDRHCQGYHDLYKPVGHPEQILVQLIADDYWRALRGRAMETARLRLTFDGHLDENNGPILAPSNVWLHNEKALGNLALYLQRIERSIKNNTQALVSMQKQRKETQAEEAKLPAPVQVAPVQRFVFSTPPAKSEDPVNQARSETWSGLQPATRGFSTARIHSQAQKLEPYPLR